MPGRLRDNADCPKCGTSLLAIIDTADTAGVTREYFHEKGSPKARRKRRCKVRFSDFKAAARERRALEIPR